MMKVYKLIKELPFCEIGKVFTTSEGRRKRRDGTLVGPSREDMLEGVIGTDEESKRLEEIPPPSYIVTEEGEIIGEYECECWYVYSNFEVFEYPSCEKNARHFITKVQAEAYVKREKSRRELRKIYYEKGYEENKGVWQIYFGQDNQEFMTTKSHSLLGLPKVHKLFQKSMLKLPRVQELYKIIFGIDD